jgi:uncharacterized protein (TIGR00725 family)
MAVMETTVGVSPLPILAVLGPSQASAREMAVAERVGAVAAGAGWVVLTGGGPGVMEAACRGAVEAGGLTVGILPTMRGDRCYPNRWVLVPITTGAGSARNVFNVLSADLCVAIGGGPGTLSEIALALKGGREIWCLGSWGLTPPPETEPPRPRVFDETEELIDALPARLAMGRRKSP